MKPIFIQNNSWHDQQDLNQLPRSNNYCAAGVCGALTLLHPPPPPQLLNHPRLVTSSSGLPVPLASTRTLPPTPGNSTASNPSSNCGTKGSPPPEDHRLESSVSACGGDGNVAVTFGE